MAEQKRNILDDVADGVRQVIEEIDRLLNPDKQRKPARVPIPVRSRPDQQHQHDRHNPYA